MSSPHVSEGTIDFKVGDESYKTWYKTFGDLKSPRTPLVVVHGGPGTAHYYLLPLADLASGPSAIPIIFYDQIGIGSSTHLRDKSPDFWTPKLFMDELENLLQHFGFGEGEGKREFDLFGHSWGGMMGSQFVATRQPKGLRRFVISNAPASMELWEKSCNELLDAMPDEVPNILRKHEEAGTMGDKEYTDTLNTYMARHVIRMPPPDGMLKTLGAMADDPTVLHATYGPKQFTIVGSLKTWSIISELHKIMVPTLLLNGRFDEANDACVTPFFNRIPKIKWYQFTESSHMPQWEERDHFMKIVREFLSS